MATKEQMVQGRLLLDPARWGLYLAADDGTAVEPSLEDACRQLVGKRVTVYWGRWEYPDLGHVTIAEDLPEEGRADG